MLRMPPRFWPSYRVDGALEVDHDLDVAGCRAHADGTDFPVPSSVACWRRGERGGRGKRDGKERREGEQGLHGVSSCLASDSVSCRSNPNAWTVKTISRGRICVTLRRPMMSPTFT